MKYSGAGGRISGLIVRGVELPGDWEGGRAGLAALSEVPVFMLHNSDEKDLSFDETYLLNSLAKYRAPVLQGLRSPTDERRVVEALRQWLAP